MKYTLAIAALLSTVSTKALQHDLVTPYIDDDGYVVMKQQMSHQKSKKMKDKPSDEICDGDSADDKQLETESDKNDDIVEDHGFSGSRGHTIRAQVKSTNYMMSNSELNAMSNAQLNAMLNARAKQKAQSKDKPSDYICDGDSADDKEIQDTADPADEVVEDFGFSGSRNARGQVRLLQTDEKIKKPSDWLANGDSADDKDLESEADPNDMIVDFNGYSNHGYAHTPYDIPHEPYKFDDAHYANNNIQNLFPEHFATKPRDEVTFSNFVQLEGIKEQSEYSSHRTGADWQLIQTMATDEAPQSTSLLQMQETFEDFQVNEDHMNLLFKVSKYSDGIANGDSADDKDLEREADPEDMIVDFNGYSNHGYAHTPYDTPKEPYKFDNAHFADNNIKNLFPEHFGTTPRDSVTFSNGH